MGSGESVPGPADRNTVRAVRRGVPAVFRNEIPMSVLRPRPPADPLVFVPEASSGPPPGGRADARRLAAGLAPLIEQPARLLADYRLERPTSELYAMLQAARRLRDHNERIVVVAPAAEAAAARAILETCCHPFHADLPRAERGGRPRITFTGDRFANDRDQGLLDLVAPAGRPQGNDLLDRWALVIVAGRTLPAAVAATARLFLHALADGGGGAVAAIDDHVAAVGAPLVPLMESLRAAPPFTAPGHATGCHGVFTAAALLPAAIAGIDVVRLLEGAVAMNMRLDEAPPDDNPVLGLLAAWRRRDDGTCRRHRLSSADERLARLIEWFDALQDLSIADATHGGTTGLVAVEPRRDPLRLPPAHPWTPDGDGLPIDGLIGATWPDLEARATAGSSTSAIRLPRVDEHAIGQLVQMLLLATGGAAGDAPATDHGGRAGPRMDPV